MQIITEKNFIGADPNHPDAEFFHVLKYEDGNLSHIPKKFFRNNHDEDILNLPFGEFIIGRDSIFGPGSVAKYDSGRQKLVVGRHVRAGLRVKLILNGQHNVDTMAMSMFSGLIRTPPAPQYGDLQIKNDIWIGDETMILGGATIENGCVIGARSLILPNFQTEPFGIYSGSPARLIRFRFSEKII
jgi:acetyltransferase-like isoleucine patch superfamily enzyme